MAGYVVRGKGGGCSSLSVKVFASAASEVQEILVGISRRMLWGRKLVELMHRVPYFDAINSWVVVEGSEMLIWLVGHQVGVLAADKYLIKMTIQTTSLH